MLEIVRQQVQLFYISQTEGVFIMADKTNTTQAETKDAPILIQMGIFAAVLFVSSLISAWLVAVAPKFPVPTPVLGLIILYLLLTFHIVKVEWVDKFATFMIGMIAFLRICLRKISFWERPFARANLT